MDVSAPLAPHAPADWREIVRGQGFVFVPAAAFLKELLGQLAGPHADWTTFGDSWSRLELDTYMADHGRYRRRRHAVFAVSGAGRIERQAHQPHWQGLDYNPLNGGVARWFAPIEDAVADSETLRHVLALTHALFQPLSPEVLRWKAEVHQFRIETTPDMAGLPTPEGVHRDGVDWVLVLLIHRHNIAAGTTTIHGLDRGLLGEFTLTVPGDVALVNDHRCFHGVTAVHPLDPALPAYRDVLVVTLKAQGD
jgi:hypothetical protein